MVFTHIKVQGHIMELVNDNIVGVGNIPKLIDRLILVW